MIITGTDDQVVVHLDRFDGDTTVEAVERVICGCGRPTGSYGFQTTHRDGSRSIILYVGHASRAFTNTEKGEALRIVDHLGAVVHRCPRKKWPKDATVHLESEPASWVERKALDDARWPWPDLTVAPIVKPRVEQPQLSLLDHLEVA